MRLRKIAGASATVALTAGVMAIPALLAPANAALTTTTLTGDYSCSASFGSYTMSSAFKPGLAITVDGTKAKATAPKFGAMVMGGGATWPAGFEVRGIDLAVDAELNGTATSLVGSSDGLALPTSAEIPTPALEAASTVTSLKSGKITAVSGSVDLYVPFTRSVSTIPLTCTGTSTAWEASTFTCTYSAWTLGYSPKTTFVQDGKNVTLSMDAFPAIAGPPPFVTVSKVVANASATVGGKAVTLTGSQVVDPATPMSKGFVVPALTATLPTGLPAGKLEVTGLDFLVTAMESDTPIPCAMAETLSFDVASTELPKPPVVKAAATKSVTKVAYNKKAKKATVTTTVKAGKKSATGKVTIVVKKGKKVVSRKTVTLKKGKATLVVKKGQLKKKGVYTVTANYAGTKAFKKSAAKKVTFRVK